MELRITQKLGVLVAVPLCAVSGFGALALTTSATGFMQADHLWSLMNTGTPPGSWPASCNTSARRPPSPLTAPPTSSSVQNFTGQVTKTLAAANEYQDLVGGLHTPSATTMGLLDRISTDLTALTTCGPR